MSPFCPFWRLLHMYVCMYIYIYIYTYILYIYICTVHTVYTVCMYVCIYIYILFMICYDRYEPPFSLPFFRAPARAARRRRSPRPPCRSCRPRRWPYVMCCLWYVLCLVACRLFRSLSLCKLCEGDPLSRKVVAGSYLKVETQIRNIFASSLVFSKLIL